MIKNRCLLLIDDHRLLLDGLEHFLRSRFRPLHLESATSMQEALKLNIQPDLVVLDILMPHSSGLDGLALLKQRWPRVRVVVMSSQDDALTREEALLKGAECFISKAEAGAHLADTLQALLQAKPNTPNRHSETATLLTPRQYEVLELLSQGQANKVMARHLGLSDKTVRRHLQDIYAFLDVNNRTEAVAEARRRGLIS